MRKKLYMAIIVLAGTMMLSGCLEDFQVTLHEAGVYKGPSDPLVGMGSQSSTLGDRFNTIQTDR